MPQMVNSLMKLGLPQAASLENRRLAIDLAALVVHWEKQRIDGPPATAVRSLCTAVHQKLD